MRFFLILFFISSFSSIKITAQEKKWLDKNENTTTKEKAVFYSVFSYDKRKKNLVTNFFITGKKAKEYYLVNGIKEGKSLVYYKSGEVKKTGKYKNGLKDGVWKTYYKNGKIKKKGKYFKGGKVGVWKHFYKNN